MTTEQFGVLIKLMKAVYPQPNFLPDAAANMVWFDMLCDLDFGVAQMAVKKYIQTSKYPPTVADIREYATQTDEMTEMEAWSLVYKALSNGYYGAETEFEKLPEDVQRAVGSPANIREWSQMDIDTVSGVIHSNFLRAYKTVCERRRQEMKMSPRLRELTAQTAKMLEVNA